MEYTFEEIYLSDEEFEALKTVNESAVLLQKDNVAVFNTLKGYGFIDIIAYTQKLSPNVDFFGYFPKYVSITLRGKSYLNYISTVIKEKKNNAKHEWLIALVSAFFGAVLAELCHFLADLL